MRSFCDRRGPSSKVLVVDPLRLHDLPEVSSFFDRWDLYLLLIGVLDGDLVILIFPRGLRPSSIFLLLDLVGGISIFLTVLLVGLIDCDLSPRSFLTVSIVGILKVLST